MRRKMMILILIFQVAFCGVMWLFLVGAFLSLTAYYVSRIFNKTEIRESRGDRFNLKPNINFDHNEKISNVFGNFTK